MEKSFITSGPAFEGGRFLCGGCPGRGRERGWGMLHLGMHLFAVNIPMTIGNSTVSALNIYCKYVRVKNAMCHLCFALQGK